MDIRDQGRLMLLKQEYCLPVLGQCKFIVLRQPQQLPAADKAWGFGPHLHVVMEVTSTREYLLEEYVELRGEHAKCWPWADSTKPRLALRRVIHLKPGDIGRTTQGFQNGHIQLSGSRWVRPV